MKVGIVGRGLHGYQTAEEMSRHFKVTLTVLPERLPELIESVDELPELKKVLDSDLIICYAEHPDVSLILSEVSRAKLLIITGRKTGSEKQIKSVAKKRGIKVLMPEICCVVRELNEFGEFFNIYGKPKLSLKVKGEKIVSAEVEKCAFCGATRFVAEKLIGVDIDSAPRLAGLYTQLYPCMASRGFKGGIHLAAEMHRIAVKRALSGAGGI